MLTDIVIPYRFSQMTRDQELRYALRGIEKHLTGVRSVYLVGDKPNYIQDVCQIPFKEKNWYTELTKNIYLKLLLACNTAEISDPFIYFNDDHFLLTDYQALNIPYYHKGRNWQGSGKYHVTVKHTLEKYPTTDNFDTHAPMIVHKDLYIRALTCLPWKTDFGFCIKTCYCAFFGIRGEYYSDFKLDSKPVESDFKEIRERKFFSVGDKAFTLGGMPMFNFMESLYPDKSKYEI